MPSPILASRKLVSNNSTEHFILAFFVRDICVETFPRFANAASVINSKPYFQQRSGQKVWDHTNLAVTIWLTQVDAKPACVMKLVTRRWREGDWAHFAIPIFGAAWESDQTIISQGETHPGDNFQQHLIIHFPTHQTFKFDADQRSDRRWTYTISLIAK